MAVSYNTIKKCMTFADFTAKTPAKTETPSKEETVEKEAVKAE